MYVRRSICLYSLDEIVHLLLRQLQSFFHHFVPLGFVSFKDTVWVKVRVKVRVTAMICYDMIRGVRATAMI